MKFTVMVGKVFNTIGNAADMFSTTVEIGKEYVDHYHDSMSEDLKVDSLLEKKRRQLRAVKETVQIETEFHKMSVKNTEGTDLTLQEAYEEIFK